MLIGPEYLSTGQNIDRFLKSRFVLKLIKALKRAAILLKVKGDKKKSGRIPKISKVVVKTNKNEKMLEKYIESHKPSKK